MESFKHAPETKEQRFKKALENLEGENIQLDIQEKIAILLTCEGLKPASLVEWNGQDIPEEKTNVRTPEEEVAIEEIKTTLINLGLYFDSLETVIKVSEDEYRRMTDFAVSKDQDKVSSVINWVRKNEEENRDIYNIDHHESGRNFGFPETAIEAFSKGSKFVLYPNDLPIEIRETELGRFILGTSLFTFSKEHFQEELKVYESWMNRIKEISPRLYDEAIKEGSLNI